MNFWYYPNPHLFLQPFHLDYHIPLVYHTTISFTWWIVRTTSLLISITFLVYLMPKRWRCFFGTTFYTSVKVIYFPLLLGLNGSLICCFIMIGVSGFFFLLLLRGIQRISGVTLDKLSLCRDKTETLKLSPWISISKDFSILVLLLYKLVLEIDFY